MIDKLIKQALKDESKLGKTTLKQMLDFEQRFIALSIEKIAMLDSEVKIKARKGAHFPSHKVAGKAQIEGLEEFEKDLFFRFLTEEEIKVDLLLTSLLNYIKKRLASFDCKKDSLGTKLS